VFVTTEPMPVEESKPTAPAAVPACTARSPPAIKSILKTTTTTSSESPPTPSDVTVRSRSDASTSSPSAKRRGILKKQLSFETAEESRACQPPPPPPTDPQRPHLDFTETTGDLAVTTEELAEAQSGGGGSTAYRTTPRIKNKAVARRLMLRDRRSFDDETMTSYPLPDDTTSGDAR